MDIKTVAAFKGAVDRLKSNGYLEVQRCPLREYPISEHLRIYEEKYADKEDCRIFSIASNPEIIREKELDSEILLSMYRHFFLSQEGSGADFEEMFGRQLFNELLSCGVVARQGEGFRSLYRFVPVGEKIYVTSAFDRQLPHFTYFSYDSLVFTRLIQNDFSGHERGISILDYCCGVGYVGLSLKKEKDSLLGVDISTSAVSMAKLNAALNDQDDGATFICDSMPPIGRKFDLIVCNPPFVFMPPDESGKVDSYGGNMYGLEKTIEFLDRLSALLNEGGKGYMVTTAPVINGEDYFFKVLNEKYSHLKGEYYDLCASIGSLSDWEKANGVEGANHVFISFSPSVSGKSGWKLHRATGEQRFKFAF